jgi:hypothetical protein
MLASVLDESRHPGTTARAVARFSIGSLGGEGLNASILAISGTSESGSPQLQVWAVLVGVGFARVHAAYQRRVNPSALLEAQIGIQCGLKFLCAEPHGGIGKLRLWPLTAAGCLTVVICPRWITAVVEAEDPQGFRGFNRQR